MCNRICINLMILSRRHNMAKVKISEIISHWGWTNVYPSIVTDWFKESKYGSSMVSGLTGTTIEGDPEEIYAYAKKRYNERFKIAEEYTSVTEPNTALKSSIDIKKKSLPNGVQYYEYKTIIVKDSEVLGTVDSERIELLLNSLALDGWRLKAALTNEAGHNRAVVVNATINNTILILERLVTKE